MAGPATSAGDEDVVGEGATLEGSAVDGVALEADADGVAEDSEVAGDALVAEPAVATEVVVLTAGAPPVEVGPHPASTVIATTASPATTRARGLRTITTPFPNRRHMVSEIRTRPVVRYGR